MEEILLEAKIRLADKINLSNAVILSETLPVIRCFSDEVKELFCIFLENSLKFRNQFTVPIIKISCESQDFFWKVVIADNGIGIHESNFENIFQIFRKEHHKEKYEGLGVGLAIAKKIIELHGGSISVRSCVGKGAEFEFTFSKLL